LRPTPPAPSRPLVPLLAGILCAASLLPTAAIAAPTLWFESRCSVDVVLQVTYTGPDDRRRTFDSAPIRVVDSNQAFEVAGDDGPIELYGATWEFRVEEIEGERAWSGRREVPVGDRADLVVSCPDPEAELPPLPEIEDEPEASGEGPEDAEDDYGIEDETVDEPPLAVPVERERPRPRRAVAPTELDIETRCPARTTVDVWIQSEPTRGEPEVSRLTLDGVDEARLASFGEEVSYYAEAKVRALSVRIWTGVKAVAGAGRVYDMRTHELRDGEPLVLDCEVSRIGALRAQVIARRGGLLVVAAPPRGPAGEAGIRVGDVITHVDGRRARTPKRLERALNRRRKPAIVLHRRGDRIEVKVKQRP